MNQHRIAFFIPSFRGGGAERSMIQLAAGVAERGYAVDLIAAAAVGPLAPEVPSNVRVKDLRSRRVIASLPRLVGYLRRERPGVLMAAMEHANVVALTASWLARSGTRVIVSERNNLSADLRGARSSRPKIVRLLQRWLYPHAHAIVAVSGGVAGDMAAVLRVPRESIQVLYNPVVMAPMAEAACAPSGHPWLDTPSAPVILGAGRLTPQKDFDSLVRAFAIVRAHRDCRLVIIGEGELRQSLESLTSSLDVQDAVAMPGFVANPYAYMRKASVFVLSSAWEGLPGVLIQAMACGTPVVSTDCPSGPREILENGRWGRLVAVGHPGELAEAIMSTMDAQHHPDVEARAADFTVDHAVDRFLKIVEER